MCKPRDIFGKKDAENLALRDQGLCAAAHVFAEEINTESDLVVENMATKRDELYFQDRRKRRIKESPRTKTRGSAIE